MFHQNSFLLVSLDLVQGTALPLSVHSLTMKMIKSTCKSGTQNVPTSVNGQKLRNFLSFYDLFRFCRNLSEIDQQTENVTKEKHDRNIQLLRRRRFGGVLSDKEKHILNLSDYSLSDTERFVLSNGLDFCLPPKSVNREEVLAEFEILYAQLARQKPISSNELSSLKAKLSDLAHSYCGTPVDLGDFNMHKEQFQAIKSLRCNEQILITKPDKGSGVVILKCL